MSSPREEGKSAAAVDDADLGVGETGWDPKTPTPTTEPVAALERAAAFELDQPDVVRPEVAEEVHADQSAWTAGSWSAEPYLFEKLDAPTDDDEYRSLARQHRSSHRMTEDAARTTALRLHRSDGDMTGRA